MKYVKTLKPYSQPFSNDKIANYQVEIPNSVIALVFVKFLNIWQAENGLFLSLESMINIQNQMHFHKIFNSPNNTTQHNELVFQMEQTLSIKRGCDLEHF